MTIRPMDDDAIEITLDTARHIWSALEEILSRFAELPCMFTIIDDTPCDGCILQVVCANLLEVCSDMLLFDDEGVVLTGDALHCQ